MNQSRFAKFVAGGLLAGIASLASASPCDSALSSYESAISVGDTSQAEEIASNHPECFAGGAATSNTQLNATLFSQAGAISRALASRLIAPAGSPLASNGHAVKGVAAGGMTSAWSVWANYDQTDSNFSYTALNAFKSRGANDISNSVLGVDYAIASNMVVGVSAAFDRGNAWGLNTAPGNTKNKSDTDGYTIAPYLGYQLSKEFALDVSAGWGSSDFSATGGVKADVDRWFAAGNLTYSRWMGNWQFNGKASYLHGEEDVSDSRQNGVKFVGTGSTNKLDQVRLGAQAGYWMNGFMPYAGLSYTSNIHRSSDTGDDPLGRDSFVATLGLNFFSLSSKMTGGVFYEEELSRNNSNNRLLSANINFRF